MEKNKALLRIRKELVTLYPEQDDMRRVAKDAALPLGNIRFSAKAINSWDNILTEADKLGKVVELVSVVSYEYKLSPAFGQALEAYSRATEPMQEPAVYAPSTAPRKLTTRVSMAGSEYEIAPARSQVLEDSRRTTETGQEPALYTPSTVPGQLDKRIGAQIDATVEIPMPHILTGVVQQMDRETYPLVTWTVRSVSGEGLRVLLESYIEGYTAKAIDTVEPEGTEDLTLRQLPTFFPEQVNSIRHPTRATLNLRIENLRGGVELHRTEPVWLHPKTSVPLAVQDPGTGRWQDLTQWLGAYVTPYEPSLMAFLGRAAGRHPNKRLVGYQGHEDAVRPQVEALFYELKHDAQIVFVQSVVDYVPTVRFATQRVRLPRESLADRQANSIDATLLFASLLEAISINPAIVVVPGHAFVGWETWRNNGEWEYLETTMIASHEFAQALESARQTAQRYQALAEQTDNSTYFRLWSLRQLRSEYGIMPLE